MLHGGGSFDGWLERVHPEDRERFARDVDAFLLSLDREAHVEYRLRRASGEYVPVRDRLVVERTREGEPIRLVSMVEERVPGSKTEPWSRHRHLFERTPDPVIFIDAEGRLEDCNQAFLDLFGATADSRGQSMGRWYRDPEDRHLLVEDIRREGRVSGREVSMAAADGSPRRVLLSAAGSRTPAGAWAGYQAILHDVTSMMPAEEVGPVAGGFDERLDRLRSSLAEVADRLSETAGRVRGWEVRGREKVYHQALVERSQDLLAILDAEGRIRFASPAVERLLGFDRHSLVGMSALDLVHPVDRDTAAEALAETAAAGRVPTLQHRLRHADGTWRYFETTGRSFLDDPAIRGIVINTRDVTERRELEERLRHAQQMEAVARLAGGVAHEFNNLLTVIRVSTRLVADHFEEEGVPEELEDIDDAAARAAVLTRSLLAFSGRDIRNVRSLDLAALVREMEPFLARMCSEGTELVLDLPPVPLTVRADPLILEQVIVNLYQNALEAMPGGGRVVVEVRTPGPGELPSQVRWPEQWALLRVTDTGPGVPEEIRQSIFEPFFTTKEGSTGLGLATVRSVVSRLGGVVDVVGGEGAMFTVCFPRTSDREPLETVSYEPRAFPGGRTILVVEGDPAARSVAHRLLSDAGYRVLSADDGVSALTLVEAYDGPLDLLVTALEMPQVGGEALAARLQVTHPDMAVLYITSAGVEHREGDGGVLSRDSLSRGLIPAVEDLLEGDGGPAD